MFARSLLLSVLLTAWINLPLQLLDARETSDFDLTALTLEELINVEVSLASRKKEKLFETAAAAFVLSRDDIRRSGATSIPEALRLVPGMQVGHIDANKWAVSARGFNDRFAQKLLVLIDGRNIYSPLFSGVFWEGQDVMLEDVERIEIIRGPGATLWGANAVNGIVNIITRSAADTRGGLVRLGGGSEERGFGTLRYGGNLGANADYRIYIKYFDRDAFVDSAGRRGDDAWDMSRGGWRLDWQADDKNTLTLQSSLYDGQVGQTFRQPTLEPPFLESFATKTQWSGGYLLSSWKHTFTAKSDLRLQLYYDRQQFKDSTNAEERDTYDIDFQHRFARGKRHDIIWGLGYRFTSDTTGSSFKASFDPAARSTYLYSAFVQDEIDLIPQRLRLTLGSKFEHNAHTGFEYQPNARLLWTPQPQHVLWGAVSRALRTPARADDDINIAFRTFPAAVVFPLAAPDTPPILAVIRGNRAFEPEELLAYELGYRLQPHHRLFFDLATFYNDYSDLRAAINTGPFPQNDATIPHSIAYLTVANLMEGKAYGGELAANWQWSHQRGRLRAAYSYLKIDLDVGLGADPESATAERGSPEHQFYLWPSFELRPNLQLDAIGRFVSSISDRDENNAPLYVDFLPQRDIDAYFELDLRLAWHPAHRLEIALVGHNLLDDHHPEFADFFIDSLPTQTQRSIYGSATWEF